MSTLSLRQCLTWLLVCSSFLFADDTRLYTGAIQIPTLGDLNMTLGVSETEEGTYLLLTVPSQGAENVPMLASFQQDRSMHAELPQAQLTFVVQENEEQTELTGTMIQGLEFPVHFKRVDSIPTLVRPQEPLGPFPYSQREVTVLHPDGHLLQGTLTIPQGEGEFPCAVLISGSGMQDRDESIMGHKPFLVIADYVTRRGIAVLRFDDRGVGGSTVDNLEDLLDDTSEDFATDVSAMVHAARLHEQIDNDRVGVIGHSEGGLIGPMVAVEDSDVAFVVMLAGPGVPGKDLLPVQQAMLMESTGAEEEDIEQLVNASMLFYESLEGDANDEELRAIMEELVAAQLYAQDLEVTKEQFEEGVDEGLATLASPWMQFFLFYDPADALSKVRCPVLAMNGTNDVQVSSKQNLPAIAEIFTLSEGDVTIIELEGLNHLFQPSETGAIFEYSQIETTFDPEALELMTDWISTVTEDD